MVGITDILSNAVDFFLSLDILVLTFLIICCVAGVLINQALNRREGE